MKKGRLFEKIAVVTGASSGIGRATAIGLAEEGAKVALMARREDRLQEVAQEIQKKGGEAWILPLDVTLSDKVREGVEKVLQKWGHIDLLINNAGFGLSARVEEMTSENLHQLMEVNLFGPFYGIQAVLPHMRRQGQGHIINVATVGSKVSFPFYSGYCASKFALLALNDALRMELHGTGIQVSIVLPAATETEFFETASRLSGRTFRPVGMVQSAQTVAQSIIRCAIRPKPRVYPLYPSRWLGLFNEIAPGWVDFLSIRYRDRIAAEKG
ncbi:MAG: SDR family NAD(P)-dependent oxidoreductase [Deltaproteobacteria bacterium]|nr:SDR family NAD(P)-dependent oxidoreductase [Deltaproteobacteria bacterium]